MKHFPKVFRVLAASALIGLPGIALSEECLDEVRALWNEGGPLDPYQRPPHRNTNTVRDADGNVTRVFDAVIETPLRTIAGVRDTHMTLAIDNDVWTGPGVEGPWTPQQGFTGDRRAGHEAQRLQLQANATDIVCHGMVERDGATYLAYGYTSKTDPDEAMGGSWFGSTDTVYLDPESRQVMIWEMGNFKSSWAPEPNGETHSFVYEYDPTIKVTRPE